MTTRAAKIVRFPSKRRHVRGRLTGTGEFLRLIVGRRGRGRGEDDGPSAA
ncbi:MAG TPA: hypothetical protein VFC31_09525 [Candidatus Limnocylindria bacterium]|nr:hypothetical protein [Candidatus Limnocylindria bacterium]